MESPRWSRRSLLSAAGVALAGCSTSPGESPTTTPDPPAITLDPPTDPPTGDVEATVLVENLEVPWDIAAAPNGDLFVTERVGRVNRFVAGQLDSVLEPADAIDAEAIPAGSDDQPWWVEGGEGGTLGAAVHPDFPDPSWLYVYYTAKTSSGTVNRVSRFDVDADDPAGSEQIVVDGIPAHQVHNGGRIRFGPDRRLWVTTGTASFDKDEATDAAADTGSLAGKVLRITPEGEPAAGNPDLGTDADPRVYTYGHRNPQGIVQLPGGAWLVNEHGGAGHDEINRLVAGDDYGWPNTPRSREKYAGNDDVHAPMANSGSTTWAPTGSVFYTGDAIPSWSDRMLIGGLISQQILVATIGPSGADLPDPGADGWSFTDDWYDDAADAVVHPVLRNELGRVRHLEQARDGALYAITSNRDGRAQDPFPRDVDDVLVRLDPSAEG
jgi:glucose/arabinose dehydrogenase